MKLYIARFENCRSGLVDPSATGAEEQGQDEQEEGGANDRPNDGEGLRADADDQDFGQSQLPSQPHPNQRSHKPDYC